MQMFALVVAFALLAFLQDFLYINFWTKNLTAELSFSKSRMTEGERVILTEKLENRKWLPLPVLFLKFNISKNFSELDANAQNQTHLDHYARNEMFTLMMRQRITRKVVFECKQRGIYRVNRFEIVSSSLFQSADYVEEYPCDKELIVYPCGVDIGRFMPLFRSVFGDVVTRQFIQEDPYSYRGVREYQPYDRMKLINWKATSRTGELKVHVLEHTSSRNVSVYLNLQRENMIYYRELMEESIRLAKSFCTQLAKQGIHCSLYTNGFDGETEEIISIPSDIVGLNYIEKMNEGLARIEICDGNRIDDQNYKKHSNFIELYGEQMRQEANDRYLIVISSCQISEFQNLLAGIRRKSEDISWVIPVSDQTHYHPSAELSHSSKMWRLNWEGARRVGVTNE